MLLRSPRPRLLTAGFLLGGFVLGALASLLIGPRTPSLGDTTSGDAQLAADVRASLVSDRGYSSMSVVRVRDGQISYAGLGEVDGRAPTPQTQYELGSLTKTFTGLLLADGVQRRELRLEDPVSDYLPELRGTPVGRSTLRSLATHTAGLPPFPDAMAARIAVKVLGNDNSYDVSTESMLEAVRTTKVTAAGSYKYSNLGMSLLGHAEARAAGAKDWPTLATDRLLVPLGMRHTHFAMTRGDVPADAAAPNNQNGWPAAHWYGPAFAPAGSSTWTTAEDLGSYAKALLAGRVPGASAMDPVLPIPHGQIGLAWHLTDAPGRRITWHNGATGGYRTIMGLDRERRQAVVILGNSGRAADKAGISLAATAPGAPVRAVETQQIGWSSVGSWSLVGLALLVGSAFGMIRAASRLALVAQVLSGLAGLAVLLAHGPWALLPAWIWGGLAGATLVLAGLCVPRARSLPTYPARRRTWSWLSLIVTVGLLAVVLWTM